MHSWGGRELIATDQDSPGYEKPLWMWTRNWSQQLGQRGSCCPSPKTARHLMVGLGVEQLTISLSMLFVQSYWECRQQSTHCWSAGYGYIGGTEKLPAKWSMQWQRSVPPCQIMDTEAVWVLRTGMVPAVRGQQQEWSYRQQLKDTLHQLCRSCSSLAATINQKWRPPNEQ